ncbi:MAG: EVE domain-containing protein [Myxococcota bacterium]
MPRRAKKYWLMKSEPDVFSIDDLAGETPAEWEGVRNYQARNYMREMKKGDLVLFYHSNAKPSGVAGVAKIEGEARPDPHQFDPKSPYFDAKSKKEEPRWDLVDVGFVEKLDRVIPLAELKAEAKLEGMFVIRKGMRISVTPVEKKHFQHVLRMAKAKTKVR